MSMQSNPTASTAHRQPLDWRSITAADVREIAAAHDLTFDASAGWYSVRDGRKLCCPSVALAIAVRPDLADHGWAGLGRRTVERASGLPPEFLDWLILGFLTAGGDYEPSARHDESWRKGFAVGRELGE